MQVPRDALQTGKSLLPAGVTKVTGVFERGDPVRIIGPDRVFGTGLSRYTSSEAALDRWEAIEVTLRQYWAIPVGRP